MMSAKFWTYTARCEACSQRIDYLVQKKNSSNDGYTYAGFAAYVQTMPAKRWLHCEKCDRISLQTLVAYDSPEES
jgi:hypothetical protein